MFVPMSIKKSIQMNIWCQFLVSEDDWPFFVFINKGENKSYLLFKTFSK